MEYRKQVEKIKSLKKESRNRRERQINRSGTAAAESGPEGRHPAAPTSEIKKSTLKPLVNRFYRANRNGTAMEPQFKKPLRCIHLLHLQFKTAKWEPVWNRFLEIVWCCLGSLIWNRKETNDQNTRRVRNRPKPPFRNLKTPFQIPYCLWSFIWNRRETNLKPLPKKPDFKFRS